MSSERADTDNDTNFVRFAIVAEFAAWLGYDPQAAERWSKLTDDELLEYRSPGPHPGKA